MGGKDRCSFERHVRHVSQKMDLASTFGRVADELHLMRRGGMGRDHGPRRGQDRVDSPSPVFIDHIAHAIQVAGPDHVGLGLDFGYGVPAPVGLEDASKLEAITYELRSRGFDESTVRKTLGENTLRVMGEAERVAARLADSR